MHSEDTFHALHVVSDLHLGGQSGFQIFDQGETLAGFIESLIQPSAGETVALVLNGDVVDFLAEEKARYLDPEGALGKFERILGDSAFAPVWGALRKYTATPGRTLVVAMGNHDVELALPPVRARLIEALCGDSLEARGRLRLVMDGSGYAARVGRARVLCVHGNEVDGWNWIDHEALRRLIRAMNMSAPLPEWKPNAGTRLVVDVMNDVKKRHPLVDLLKPEGAPIPAVLLALEPSLFQRLEDLFPVAARKAADAMRRPPGLLSSSGAFPAELEGEGARPSMPLARETWLSEEELLTRSRQALDMGRTALDFVESPQAENRLGMMSIVRDLVFEKDPRESLRKSLRDWLQGDLTFHQLDAHVGEDIDFLIAGHTHLERALKRERGEGYYFNTGTWARLISLTPDKVNDATTFERVYAAFAEGRMAALDGFPDLILRRPTVVSITQRKEGTVRGQLGHVKKGEKDYTLEPIKHFDVRR